MLDCGMSTQFSAQADAMPITILIVEDDPLVRTYHAALVTASGYQPRTAPNGEAALAVLQEEPLPDLIMLDMEMPQMNGRAFRRCQLADERLSRIPILVCTGFDTPVDDPLFAGCLMLEKPATIGAIRERLRVLLTPPSALAISAG